MSSEKFEGLEDDFRNICLDAEIKLNERIPKVRGEEKKRIQRAVQRQIEEAEALLVELDVEVRGAPQPFRNQMMYKVRSYRQQVAQLSIKLKNSYTSDIQDRQEVYQGTNPFIDPVEANHRALLLQTNDLLSNTSERILRSHQIAAETDEIGQQVVQELGEQRESLVRTKDRLVDTDQALSRSRRILNAMSRSMLGNKLILIFVILAEIGIFSGVLYMRFLKSKK